MRFLLTVIIVNVTSFLLTVIFVNVGSSLLTVMLLTLGVCASDVSSMFRFNFFSSFSCYLFTIVLRS